MGQLGPSKIPMAIFVLFIMNIFTSDYVAAVFTKKLSNKRLKKMYTDNPSLHDDHQYEGGENDGDYYHDYNDSVNYYKDSDYIGGSGHEKNIEHIHKHPQAAASIASKHTLTPIQTKDLGVVESNTSSSWLSFVVPWISQIFSTIFSPTTLSMIMGVGSAATVATSGVSGLLSLVASLTALTFALGKHAALASYKVGILSANFVTQLIDWGYKMYHGGSDGIFKDPPQWLNLQPSFVSDPLSNAVSTNASTGTSVTSNNSNASANLPGASSSSNTSIRSTSDFFSHLMNSLTGANKVPSASQPPNGPNSSIKPSPDASGIAPSIPSSNSVESTSLITAVGAVSLAVVILVVKSMAVILLPL